MEWESDSPCCSHTYPRQCSGWELEFRDCGAIPGQDCCRLRKDTERCIKGMWRRRWWWEKPVEESPAAVEARRYAQSCIGGGAITIASLPGHTSTGSWAIEWLAHQTPEALNYRGGPHPGSPSMCPRHQTTERDPRPGSPLRAWTGGATEKHWPKRPSDPQLQEAKKDSDRA